MENILKEAIENEMREEIAADLRGELNSGGGVELSPFDIEMFHGALSVLRNTDEGDFMTSVIFPVMGLEETPERREKVTESLRKIDAAGLLYIPEFHKDEYDKVPYDDMPTPWDGQRGTTWNGLNAKAMASVLDYFFDNTSALDNDGWNELFKMHGSPYRVDYYGGVYAEALPVEAEGGGEKEEKAPANALHWRVVGTDEQGNPIILGAFYTKGDAEEYALSLKGMGRSAIVEEIA